MLAGPVSQISSVATSKDTNRSKGLFAACTESGSLYVYEIGNEHQPLSAKIEQGTTCAEWGPDGSVIAVGTEEGSILLISAANLSILQNIKVNTGGAIITLLRFSPLGSQLAAACSHRKLRLLTLQGRGMCSIV